MKEPECRWPFDSPQHRLIEKYIRVTRLHRSVIEHQLEGTGVYRSQHQILMYVSNNPNVSQKDLAKMYGVSGATIAVSLKKLEKGGYIKRLVDQPDMHYGKGQDGRGGKRFDIPTFGKLYV